MKADPRLINAARELRDWWLKKVNERPMIDVSKYDLTRAALPATQAVARELPLLAA